MTDDSCFESVRFYHHLLLLLQLLLIIIAMFLYVKKREWESWGVYGLGFGVLQHEVENLLQENQEEGESRTWDLVADLVAVKSPIGGEG